MISNLLNFLNLFHKITNGIILNSANEWNLFRIINKVFAK